VAPTELWRRFFTPRRRLGCRGTIVWLVIMAGISMAFCWKATH